MESILRLMLAACIRGGYNNIDSYCKHNTGSQQDSSFQQVLTWKVHH